MPRATTSSTGGELSVVGDDPDYAGRSRRLVGLLVDRRFGLAAWSPAWFLVPAAAAVVARRCPRARWLLLAPLAAGWLTASFVALTMHGFWSPGRQVVVVAPLAVLCCCVLAQRWRPALWLIAAGGLVGASNWLHLAWEATTGRRRLIVDFHETAAPAYRLVSSVLPDGIRASTADDVGLVVWAALLALSVCAVLRRDTHGPLMVPRASGPAAPRHTDESATLARSSIRDLGSGSESMDQYR